MTTTSGAALTELAQSLATVRPFPRVVFTIRRAAADPRNGAAEIGRLVESDVGIAANLLRVVNAPTSGLARKCDSIRHAVSLLGVQRVAELVTSAAALAVLEAAQRTLPSAAGHAIAVGGVARLLAPMAAASPDSAFTTGLLHDVGSLLLLQAEDNFYQGLVEQYGEDREPSCADERTLLGFDHALLGAEVLRIWNLPDPMPQVVELHHDWEAARKVGGPALCVMIGIVRVADILVRKLPQTAEPTVAELTEISADPAFAYIGLNADELLKLWPGLRRACDKAEAVGEGPPPASARDGIVPPSQPTVTRHVHQPESRGGKGWIVGVVAGVVVVAGLVAALLFRG